jgi:hypothetical protein
MISSMLLLLSWQQLLLPPPQFVSNPLTRFHFATFEFRFFFFLIKCKFYDHAKPRLIQSRCPPTPFFLSLSYDHIHTRFVWPKKLNSTQR